MPRLHAEALIFALLWAGLAIYAGLTGGWWLGGILSVALFAIVMPLSTLVLAKTGNFAAERQLRWGFLAASAVGLIVWLNR